MRQTLMVEYFTDEAGKPSGGQTTALGLQIDWQNGPMVDPITGKRLAANGCFVETVIQAAVDRLRFYQRSRFECAANEIALDHLAMALAALEARTRDRETRGVEGTHQP